MNSPGMHGKLPFESEWVSHEMPVAFVHIWNRWLEGALCASQAQLGRQWLPLFLSSPVWRFVLSAGVVDDRVWAGVMIPSVDSVGRYYPFVVAQAFDNGAAPTEYWGAQREWFEEIEQTALSGLQDGVTIESLGSALKNINNPGDMPRALEANLEHNKPLVLPLEGSENPLYGYPSLLNAFLSQRYPSYSLWWTQGSEQVEPAHLITGHLPSPQCYTSLLAGDWEQHGWQLP